ncbi:MULTISPECIES: hypothetical protein [unclassified Microbacterium]|uniref:hypothetical protein n=1 Tax=unclassified Microbacterium TaxID=2609290 RepID=UPI0038644AE5
MRISPWAVVVVLGAVGAGVSVLAWAPSGPFGGSGSAALITVAVVALLAVAVGASGAMSQGAPFRGLLVTATALAAPVLDLWAHSVGPMGVDDAASFGVWSSAAIAASGGLALAAGLASPRTPPERFARRSRARRTPASSAL